MWKCLLGGIVYVVGGTIVDHICGIHYQNFAYEFLHDAYYGIAGIAFYLIVIRKEEVA